VSGDSFARQPPRVVGRYAVCDAIAAGGMATVHLGRLVGPVGFSRTVAIKRLHPQFSLNEEFVGMFLDEARLVGRIRHPNVIPTLDVVSTPGELFLVMDYVPGESLSKLLKGATTIGHRLPPRVIASIVAATLHGLHAAHEARDEHGQPLGIVHRDVSPQNVLVGTDGVPRILDFGVAKAAGRVQTTQAGQLKGKLAYMAPEQIRSDVVNRQTDVYAASIVLWESLTGQRLYEASNEGALLAMVMEAKAAPPSTLALAAPGPLDDEARRDLVALDAIVMRGLSKDPSRRFATAREMALALESRLRPATAAEISAWVEAAAAPALAKRAQLVATIERDEALLRGVSQVDIDTDANTTGNLRSLAPPAPSSLPVPRSLPSTPPPGAASEISGVSGASQLSKVAFAAASAAPPRTASSHRLPLLVVAGSTLFGVGVAAALLAVLFSRMHGGHDTASAVSATPPPPSAMSVPAPPTAPPAPPVPAADTALTLTPTPTPTFAPDAGAIELLATPPDPTPDQAITPPTTSADAGGSSTGPDPASTATHHHHHHGAPPPDSDTCSPPFTVDESGIRHYKPQCI
jgi:serine/threonine-protein kinase